EQRGQGACSVKPVRPQGDGNGRSNHASHPAVIVRKTEGDDATMAKRYGRVAVGRGSIADPHVNLATGDRRAARNAASRNPLEQRPADGVKGVEGAIECGLEVDHPVGHRHPGEVRGKRSVKVPQLMRPVGCNRAYDPPVWWLAE